MIVVDSSGWIERLKRELSEDDAVIAISAMQRSQVVAIDQEIALTAADLSLEHGLAMADALVLATARKFHAELVTSDGDFERLDGVTYLPKSAPPGAPASPRG